MRSPDLQQNFARLERDVRRMRTALLLLLIVAAGVLLAQLLPRHRADAVEVLAASALLFAAAEIAGYVWRQAHTVPEVLRAKKFEVIDDDGHIFVEIGETVDGRGAVVTHDGDSNAVLTPARNHTDGDER